MDDDLRPGAGEDRVEPFLVANVDFVERKSRVPDRRGEVRPFESRGIVVVEVVDAGDGVVPLQKPFGKMGTGRPARLMSR